MEAKTMLDQLAAAIERVLKSNGEPKPTVRKMSADGLVVHAVAEIQKAAEEPSARAARRLAALRRAVDTAKQAFVDTESEEIEVEIFEEDTTARTDDSEKETSPVALEAALGNSTFAANPEDLHKALGRLAKEISALRGGTSAEGTKGGKVETEKGAKPAEVAWPFDMNTPAFRENVHKAEEGPAWGFDPGREDAPAKP